MRPLPPSLPCPALLGRGQKPRMVMKNRALHSPDDCRPSFGTVLQNMLKLHADLYGLVVMHDTEYKRAHIAPLPLLCYDLEADLR